MDYSKLKLYAIIIIVVIIAEILKSSQDNVTKEFVAKMEDLLAMVVFISMWARLPWFKKLYNSEISLQVII